MALTIVSEEKSVTDRIFVPFKLIFQVNGRVFNRHRVVRLILGLAHLLRIILILSLIFREHIGFAIVFFQLKVESFKICDSLQESVNFIFLSAFAHKVIVVNIFSFVVMLVATDLHDLFGHEDSIATERIRSHTTWPALIKVCLLCLLLLFNDTVDAN